MFYSYLKWKFIDSSLDFLKSWRLFLIFGLNIFSVPILMKTFFSPWHRYRVSYPKGFDLLGVFSAFFTNSMSRVIGVILRLFFILIGLFFEVFILIFGFILFLIWFFLPFLILYFLYLGILFLM